MRALFFATAAWAGMSFGAPAPAAIPSFRVNVSTSADVLSVEASFPAGATGQLELDDGGERYLRDVEVDQRGRWVPLAQGGPPGLSLPECLQGCRLRYRLLLREAAQGLENPQAAALFGGALVSPPSFWLLHASAARIPGYRVQFAGPGAAQSRCGLPRTADNGSYQSTFGMSETPLCTFGAWRVRQVSVGRSVLTLAIAPVHFALSDADIEHWVAEAALAVASYYQGFPVPQLLLVVAPESGGHLSGFTLGGGGASILLRLGTALAAAQARSHWVLTHELMHLGFPSLSRRHLWMEEGMAVFGEPLVRVRAGMVDEAVLWSEWLEQGPLGLPRPGEGGLETTHTWARTYWGGAVFWLVADIAVRERTGNTHSADDVLRALVAAGGNVSEHWEMADVLRVADAATGVPVFSELFASEGELPGAPDLASLFQRLGVSLVSGKVVYDETAPLAPLRRAMVGRTR